MLNALHEMFHPEDALMGSAHVMCCVVELLQAFDDYAMKGESPMPAAIDAVIQILENEKQNYK